MRSHRASTIDLAQEDRRDDTPRVEKIELRSLMLALLLVVASVLVLTSTQLPATAAANGALVERFLTYEDPAPLTHYRALRHMRAGNERFKKEARLVARTTFDPVAGFRYVILSSEGSSLVRDRALLPILEGEARAWSDGTAKRSALTEVNYEFSEAPEPSWVRIRPRRSDKLLVEGAILVEPGTGDLLRIEGRLAKSPSFWTRRVEINREYQRIGGVRVPIRVASRASLRLFGVSTFEMTYEYEEVNGAPVGASPTSGIGR